MNTKTLAEFFADFTDEELKALVETCHESNQDASLKMLGLLYSECNRRLGEKLVRNDMEAKYGRSWARLQRS